MSFRHDVRMITRTTFTPDGPFSLDPVRKMGCGFLLGTRACSPDGAVRVAFPSDGSFQIVGAKLTAVPKANASPGSNKAKSPDADDTGSPDASVDVALYGAAEPGRVKAQLARALCLDHDARPFAQLLARDPALTRVASRRPGFRPVVAYSPYVMAAWCILSQRLAMAQAARIQVRMSETFGDVIDVDGVRIASFPRPESILSVKSFPSVADEKWTRLRGVAEAALHGELDAARLLSLPYDFARAKLMSLRGVGAWSADGTLIRGAGPTDVLPITEPRLHAAVGHTYGLGRAATTEEVLSISESWRPFRTWVSVLLISHDYGRASTERPAFVRGAKQSRSRATAVRSIAS
jgi:DNA-3-methyladenine glycosylase II